MTAASAGSAVQAACFAVREKLFRYARGLDASPLANASLEHVTFADGRIVLTSDPTRAVTFADAMRAGGVDRIAENGKGGPGMVRFVVNAMITGAPRASYSHSAIFAEVKIDEELGVIRVTRIVNAVAAGRILNLEDGAQPDPRRCRVRDRHGARQRSPCWTIGSAAS